MQPLELRHSILRSGALAFSGGVCALYSLASALQWLPANAAQGRTGYLIGLAIFLPFTAWQVWRIFDRKPVITVNSDGIIDRRLAPQMIRWRDVAEIAEGVQRRNKFLLLKLKEEAGADLTLTYTGKLYQDGLKASGIEGLRIAAQGLDHSHEDLSRAVADVWRSQREAAPQSASDT